MEKSKMKHDLIPERFKTIDEMAKFWDTQDTEDYPENWREASVIVSMKSRNYPRIMLEPKIAHKLNQRARTEGISLNELVNKLLKETFRHASR